MRFFAILIGFFFFAQPALASVEFVDTAGHPHESYIQTVADLGIVQGYGYGIFRPDISINRAEFLKIIMLSVFGDETLSVGNTHCFTDFVGEEQWYWKYACTAKERGIIHGYPDGSFRGAQTVNLAEATKIAIESWDIPIADAQYASDYWYVPYFEVAAEKGVFSYFPRNGAYLLTRSDMTYLVVTMNEPLQDVSHLLQVEPLPAEEQSSSTSVSEESEAGLCGDGVRQLGEECDDGNRENGDGCSSICVVVPEPLRHAAMRIEQHAITTPAIAIGTDDVLLLSFDAIAGRQDARLTTIGTRAAAGSVEDAQNYRVLFDSDNDGLVDTEAGTASPQNNSVQFDGLDIALPEGHRVRVEIRADFQENIQPGSFALEFNTADSLFLHGVGVEDGREVSGIELNGAACQQVSICWIAVYTQPTSLIQLIARGSLFVTEHTLPISNHQLVGSQISDIVLRFTMRAEGENIQIDRLRITGAVNSVDHLLIYQEGTSAPIATARVSSCPEQQTNQYCADMDISIPADKERDYYVKAFVKPDTQGAVSGDSLQLTIAAGTIAAPTLEAVGMGSQMDLDVNNGDSTAQGEVIIGREKGGSDKDINGEMHDIVLAKITEIQNTGDADGTPVPSGIAPIGKFTFTAAKHSNSNGGLNDVEVRELVFDVQATNVEFEAGSFELINTLNASEAASCTATGITDSITVTCADLHQKDVSTVIESDKSIELALRGNILNSQVFAQNDSTLQVMLQNLSDPGNPGTIEWSDEEEIFDWVDIGEVQVRSTTYSK